MPPIKEMPKSMVLPAAEETVNWLYVSSAPTVIFDTDVGLKLFVNVTLIAVSLTVAVKFVGVPFVGIAKSRPCSIDFALCVTLGSTRENLSDPDE